MKDHLPFCVCATPRPFYHKDYKDYCKHCGHEIPLPPQGEKIDLMKLHMDKAEFPDIFHKESSVKEERKHTPDCGLDRDHKNNCVPLATVEREMRQRKETPVEEWERELNKLGHWDDEGWIIGDPDDLKDWIAAHLAEERQRGRDEACEYTRQRIVAIDLKPIDAPSMEFDTDTLGDLVDEAAKSPREGAEGKV